MADLPTTVDEVIQRALDGYAALIELGEEVEDEWSYVMDLSQSWQVRLEAVAGARAGERVDPEIGAAVVAAVDEAASISDPHRAIDWLSTFPQVVLVSLGERP